jgi:hypothetical protein
MSGVGGLRRAKGVKSKRGLYDSDGVIRWNMGMLYVGQWM